jgi:hypothetical protein
MKPALPLRALSSTTLLILIGLLTAVPALAQQEVGGPYTVDDQTVVLMHFDDNFANASDLTEDGSAEGDVTFSEETPQQGFGQSAFFDNSETKSVVTIADTSGLDMTGDWTIETWVRTSFGNSGPRLIMKPGNPAFQTNYYMAVEDRGDEHAHRGFRTGYRAEGNQFSADSLLQDNRWYHVTYIRDTQREQLMQVIRDADRGLVFFATYAYSATPGPTDRALHIGGHPGFQFLRLTGNMDEVRISSTVREALIPNADAAQVAVSSGQTGTVLDTLDTQVSLSTGSSNGGTLYGTRRNTAPLSSSFQADSSASSPDGTSVTPNTIVSDRYWLVDKRGLSGFEAEVCVTPGISDSAELVIVKRQNADSTWAPLNTTSQSIDGATYLCADGQTKLSEFAVAASEQEPPESRIGGPYAADDSTVLLMHFDGDATDASSSSLDGDLASEVSGSATPGGTQPYFDSYDGPASGFGQSIHFDNDAGVSSGEYVKVVDSGDSPLDLSGSWTVEGWARANPYNADNAPKLIHKQIFALGNDCANYLIRARIGSNLNQDAQAGFNGAGGGCNDQTLDTGDDVLQTDEWYHYAYIRDVSVNRQYLVVRDADLNVVAQASVSFSKNAIGQAGNGPDGDSLYIGVSPNFANERLEGNIDEVRISNAVRSNLLPTGIITGVRPGDGDTLYTPSNNAFTVEADIGGSTSDISSVTLHWRAGTQGMFNTVSMSDSDGDGTYTGNIPGQAEGTSVQYYVSSETNEGTRTVNPAGAESEGFLDYYGIGFSDGAPPDALVLDLNFEEGSEGNAVTSVKDSSSYDHGFEIFGDPMYRAGTKGNTALQLDGTDDYIAAGAIAPFLASEEFTLSFWFNLDSVRVSNRYVVKQGGNGATGGAPEVNYKVFQFGSNNAIRAASFQNSGGLNGGNLDTDMTPETDTWYQAVYKMSADTAFFQYRNQEGDVVGEAGYTSDALPATATRGPFFVGFSREPDQFPDQKYLAGRIDDVKLYNHPVPLDSIGTPSEKTAQLPTDYALAENYPNPFRRSTTIEYDLPTTSTVTISVYDVLGRKVKTLVSGEKPAGSYEVRFEAADLASGVYFYRLETGATERVKRMVVVR